LGIKATVTGIHRNPPESQGYVALHCARDKAADLATWLLTQGAERVTVAALEQVFDAKNPLYEALERRIGTR